MQKHSFSERAVRAALKIPFGRVTTYGRIARAAGGGSMAAQSVTSVLAKAAGVGLAIPFHRIVYANGKIWVNEKYRKERMKRYAAEGIRIGPDDRIENFRDIIFEF